MVLHDVLPQSTTANLTLVMFTLLRHRRQRTITDTLTSPGSHWADKITTITEATTLRWAFVGLILLSIVFYVAPRLTNGAWDRWDFVRASIPPLAFVGWTMLQRSTAFDAVAPNIASAPRTVLGLFLASVLGIVAAALAYKIDQKPPP